MSDIPQDTPRPDGSQSRVTRWPEGRPTPYASLDQERVVVLYGVGIPSLINPTLDLLLVDGPIEPDTTRRVIRLRLTPFSRQCEELGTIAYTGVRNPVRDVLPFIHSPSDSCPTLLFPSRDWPRGHSIPFFAVHLAQYADVARTLESARRHPDPWQRLKAGLSEPPAEAASAPESTAGGVDATESSVAQELACRLLGREEAEAGLLAFLRCWQFALDFQRMQGLQGDLVDPPELERWLETTARFCRVEGEA